MLEWITPLYKQYLSTDSYLTLFRARQLSFAIYLCGGVLLLLGTGLWLLRYDGVWFRFRRVICAITGDRTESCSKGEYSSKLSGLFIFSTLGGAFLALTFQLSNYCLPVRYRICIYAEDSVLESLTFILFMVAASEVCRAAFSLKSWYKEQPGSRTGYRLVIVAYFLIAGGFLFVGLEEVSWGQRVFGWDTPQFLTEINFQNETNLHNSSVSGLGFSYLILAVLIGLATVSVICQYWRREQRLIHLILPHPNLTILASITFYILIAAGLDLGDTRTHECAEELVAVFAFAYSVGIYKFEPLRSQVRKTTGIARIIQYSFLSLIILFSTVAFLNIYAGLYAVAKDLRGFPPETMPAANGTLEMDFGKSRTRNFLGLTGWGENESDRSLSWLWSLGPRSSLRVPLRPETDYLMEMTIERLEAKGKVQAISVDLNGSPVATITLKPKRATYRVVLPGELVKEVNTINFSFRYWVSPYSLGDSSDRRPLAVRFFEARFVVADKKPSGGRAVFDEQPNIP